MLLPVLLIDHFLCFARAVAKTGLAALSAWACFSVHAQTSDAQVPVDQKAMIRDIRGLYDTSGGWDMMAFKPTYATAARMKRFMRTPAFETITESERTNALALAVDGPDVFAFEKPSDILKKMDEWFPKRMAEARATESNGALPQIFGPLPGAHPEVLAFLSIWNCAPSQVWRNASANPFDVTDSMLSMLPMVARDSDHKRYYFDYCLSHDVLSHWLNPYSEKRQERLVLTERLKDVLEKVKGEAAPAIIDKLASHLQRNRCLLSGPDDCVFALRIWAQLAPQDPRLAAALKDLESDTRQDAPLPPMQKESSYPWDLQEDDGRDRFNTARRKSVHLMAKLSSVVGAPQSWSPEEVAHTLKQMSSLAAVFSEPYLMRFRKYAPGYYSPGIYAGDALYQPSALPLLSDAILAEIDRLGPDAPCSTLSGWFFHDSFHARFVLDALRRRDPNALRCGPPPTAWLAAQTSGPYKSLLYGLLAVLPYVPAKDREIIEAEFKKHSVAERGLGVGP